jgi:ferrochelatase
VSPAEHAQGEAVLLLAHGAPERPEDVPEFLRHVRGGRPLPPHAVEEITQRYRLIGGGSPLTFWTQRVAELLSAQLSCPVYVGMRNWKPFIVEAVMQMASDGVKELTAICMAPQNSRTSVGLYRKVLDESLRSANAQVEVRFVEEWHDQPQLIGAFADRLQASLSAARAAAKSDVPAILTAHSVPERTIKAGDSYDQEVRETARLVAERAGLSAGDWSVAYQSQGMTEEPWLGPTVESAIDGLAAKGARHLVLQPIGFLCDHVEILYDVDVVFHDYAHGHGVTLWRPESLNDHPGLLAALSAIARQPAPARR